jgi:hypothetical protein
VKKGKWVRLLVPGSWVSLILLTLAFPGLAQESAGEIGRFSSGDLTMGLPSDWKPLRFKNIKNHTDYSLVKEDGTLVIKAIAESSASGLTREVRIDPREYPILQWRWKVKNILKKSDVFRKEGDDYPARIYVAFEYDASSLGFFEKIKFGTAKLLYGRYPPLAAINYIWASKAPKGLIVPNPYTDRAMMIVVESGEEKLNQWVSEERNVEEDYRRVFRGEPPMISGVAIMTDTDNTGESAIAFYGDILFRKRSP